MRIVTCNVNGLRSADRKGFTAWMLRQKPDVVCLQEIKAQESDLPKSLLARPARLFPPRRETRLQRRRDLREARAGRRHARPGHSRDRRAGPLPAGGFRRALGRLALHALGHHGRRGAGAQVRVHGPFTTGFLPEERAWLTRVFDEHGFVDVFRRIDPSPDRFTWWVQWANARERNVGWRIDYQVATPGIAAKARKAAIYVKEVFSDHVPLVIDYDHTL